MDYNALLIELLIEKVRRAEQSADSKRKETNSLKREIRELRKALETIQNHEFSNTKEGAEK